MAEAKKTSPIFWVGLIGLSAIAYLLTSDDSTPVTKRTRKTTVSSSKDKASEYVKEDYTAKFASWTEAPRDVFKPLVIRHGGENAVVASNGLPFSLTGGEPNWTFTGVAEIDGAQNALIENSSTGEGVFLKGGESWKTSHVLTVTRDSVVLQDKDGVSHAIRLGQFGASSEEADNGSNEPVKPPLSGEIGGMSVAPSEGGASSAVSAPSAAGGSIVIGN